MRGTRKILEELRVQGARVDRTLAALSADRERWEALDAERERTWEERDAERDRRWAERDAELQAQNAELKEVVRFNSEAFRRSEVAFAGFMAEQREAREDIRARTQAIFAVIDRIQRGGGTAPA